MTPEKLSEVAARIPLHDPARAALIEAAETIKRLRERLEVEEAVNKSLAEELETIKGGVK